MAQRFSLYAELSVRENLRFFARVYGLDRAAQARAIDAALQRFDLRRVAEHRRRRTAARPEAAPGTGRGAAARPRNSVSRRADLRRRSAGAARVLDRIGMLAEAGVTILVTSHFMDEAEYCDRLGIVSQGRLAAVGTPARTARPRALTGVARPDVGGRVHRLGAGPRSATGRSGHAHGRHPADTAAGPCGCAACCARRSSTSCAIPPPS